MPYIQSKRRFFLDLAGIIPQRLPQESGELNYVLTRVCNRYIGKMGLSYRTLNDIIGALESVKLELYRRIAAPYEDVKLEVNGDVYSPENLTK